MKLILTSCDFLSEKAAQEIRANLDKKQELNKVLFIPNEEATEELINSNKYYDRLYEDGFTIKDNIYIFNEKEPDKFRNLDLDIIYVSGGNTFATLDKIRKSRFDKDIIKYINKGVTYIGGSCGTHIVTKNIEHVLNFDENTVNMKDFKGLGLFDGIIIPHYNQEEFNPEFRKEIYEKLLKDNKYKVYTLNQDDVLVVR